MFLPNDPPPPSVEQRIRGQLSGAANLGGAFATFAEVTLFRRHFGCRYFQGLRVFWALLLIPVFSLFWQGYDLRALYAVWLLFLVRCAFHRWESRRAERRSRGPMGLRMPHSLYNGRPILLPRFPKMSERDIKRKAEPAVMLAFGLASLIFSPPLGWFFLWCAVGMYMHTAALDLYERQRALDILDAAVDSEDIAARVREHRHAMARHFRSRS